MDSNSINLFIDAAKHIKFEVIDDKLYFSANGLYTFITNNNTMPGYVVDRYKEYVYFNKVNETILKGSRYGFTYALTYEEAIKFINKISNSNKDYVYAAKSVLVGVTHDFMLNNPNVAREDFEVLKSKMTILQNALHIN